MRSTRSSTSAAGALCEKRIAFTPSSFKPPQAVLPHRVRHGHANTRMVLVDAHTLQLHMHTIEEEALRRVEADGAEAGMQRYLVQRLAILQNTRRHAIQIGFLQRP